MDDIILVDRLVNSLVRIPEAFILVYTGTLPIIVVRIISSILIAYEADNLLLENSKLKALSFSISL